MIRSTTDSSELVVKIKREFMEVAIWRGDTREQQALANDSWLELELKLEWDSRKNRITEINQYGKNWQRRISFRFPKSRTKARKENMKNKTNYHKFLTVLKHFSLPELLSAFFLSTSRWPACRFVFVVSLHYDSCFSTKFDRRCDTLTRRVTRWSCRTGCAKLGCGSKIWKHRGIGFLKARCLSTDEKIIYRTRDCKTL